MRQPKRLSEEAFTRAVARLSISERRVAVARRHLVDGVPQKTIATQRKITPSAVGQAVACVWKSHLDSQEVPDGMQRITVTLPTDKAAIALGWQDEALRRPR